MKNPSLQELLGVYLVGWLVAMKQSRCSTSETSRSTSQSIGDIIQQNFGNISSDPSAGFYFFTTQLSAANLNDTMPTLPLIRNIPPWTAAQLRPCLKRDIAKCLRHGNSSNGLPARLQGILWQDGVYQPELAIATAGEWDPVWRKLRLVPSRDPIWAFNYTSSERAPGGAFWLPSGAAHFNQFAYEAVRADIFFNEDITHGQIYVQILHLDILVATILINWAMTFLPDGTWLRESSLLGVPAGIGRCSAREQTSVRGRKQFGIGEGSAAGGDQACFAVWKTDALQKIRYYLRPIIDGQGQPVARWFDSWLKSYGGDTFGFIHLVVFCKDSKQKGLGVTVILDAIREPAERALWASKAWRLNGANKQDQMSF